MTIPQNEKTLQIDRHTRSAALGGDRGYSTAMPRRWRNSTLKMSATATQVMNMVLLAKQSGNAALLE